MAVNLNKRDGSLVESHPFYCTISMLSKYPPDTCDNTPLTIHNWLNHDTWWPTLNYLVVTEVNGNVNDNVSPWFVVEHKVPALPVIPGNVHEVWVVEQLP